jgi:adenylate cyclase
VASRLEGVNKAYGTRICVSEAVFRETGDLFVMRPVDHVAVKGRRGGITVYELMAADDASEIGATERQRDLAARTTKAFFAYMDRKWEKALRTYTHAAEMYPDDRVVAKFVERCRDMLASPPDANWSGVMEMQEK